MKGFLKVFMAIIAVLATAIGALAIFDKLKNKNRIKGDYLECNTDEFADDDDEE